mmetsp:Transcript_83729/g.194776  ORF Transcript_83729/g.194776 Transcript_83729/m.194776 type:complete len:236 (-) Transcript_83729:778-1485(-)
MAFVMNAKVSLRVISLMIAGGTMPATLCTGPKSPSTTHDSLKARLARAPQIIWGSITRRATTALRREVVTDSLFGLATSMASLQLLSLCLQLSTEFAPVGTVCRTRLFGARLLCPPGSVISATLSTALAWSLSSALATLPATFCVITFAFTSASFALPARVPPLLSAIFLPCCLVRSRRGSLGTRRRRFGVLVLRLEVWWQQAITLLDRNETCKPSNEELTTYLHCIANRHGRVG